MKTLHFFLCTALLTTGVHAVTLLQVDTFVSTVEGWSGGASPAYISTGGPAGVGDGYFQISRPVDAAFHMAAKNTAQWAGDYTAAGITAITMDVNHFSGPDSIDMRILLIGVGGTWASTNVVSISSGWSNYTFGVTAADLVFVSLHNTTSSGTTDGTGLLADTLAAVNVLQFRHDASTPTIPGDHPPHIAGVLGVDNITAIPEPSLSSLLVLAGLVGLNKRRRG